MSYFYTPWKYPKTKGFMKFSGSIEMKKWTKNSLIEVIHRLPHLKIFVNMIQTYFAFFSSKIQKIYISKHFKVTKFL